MTPSNEVTNSEIFLWSLNNLGGATQFVDVEDVFVACFEAAPKRFAWRTKADLPDYKKCSKGLRDAEAKRPPLLIKTPNGFARQLTVEGQQWLASNERRLARALGDASLVPEPKQRPRARQLASLERSAVYGEWLETQAVPEEKWRIAELLRCSPDSAPSVWRDRLQTLRGMAFSVHREDVVKFLDTIFIRHSNWFEGGVL
jgi:hypothetical protein